MALGRRQGRGGDMPPRGSNGLRGASCWRRDLYSASPHPDNYTPDDCFLAAIERNKNVNKFSLAQCVPNACQVALQLCAVALFQVSTRRSQEPRY